MNESILSRHIEENVGLHGSGDSANFDLCSVFKIRRGPDGVHLFDRKTGSNILLDEYVPSFSYWTKCPRQVSIALTNTCNLHCRHCYAPKQSARLAKEQVKQWMLELDKAGCFGIGFGGGEPTLHPNLVELCEFGQQETGLAISLTTHGHTLSESLIGQLEHAVNFIRVSMDGVGATYERIRGRSFEKLMQNLTLLKGRIPYGINYVVNQYTIDDLSEAVRFVEASGADELLLLPEEPIGLGKKIDGTTLERLQTWVACYKGSIRLSISSSYRDMVDSLIALEKEPDYLAFAHIDANGQFKLTSFEQWGYVIGKAGVLTEFAKLCSEMEHEKL